MPPQSIATPDFLTRFEEIEYPRQATKIVYPLDEILLPQKRHSAAWDDDDMEKIIPN